MSASLEASCPVCKERMVVPFILVGAPTTCPSCGEIVVPGVPVGTIYPSTGHEITFSDFQQLVRKNAYRRAIKDLLDRWFDYEITGRGDSTVVKSNEGVDIDLVELHLRIQEDPTKQRELYRTAMSLWR